MDIDLLRTFLEIVETGHFIRAAERLNVTQSTVSARIKELESRLGQPVFQRGRSGASLTGAGRHFLPHATAMLRIWRQARQAVALPPEYEAVLAVGGQFSLWDRLLQRWLAWMRREQPKVALRAEVSRPDELMRLLVEGNLDLAVLYAPQARTGLRIEKLLEERLILVSTGGAEIRPGNPGYVMVDWGAAFQADHASAFPDVAMPGLSIGVGAVALNHVMAEGGGAYFPVRMVRDHLEAGRLARVAGTPEFSRPAYVAWQDREDALLARAIDGLRAVAAEEAAAG